MHVCARLLHQLSMEMFAQIQNGTAPHDAWNNSLVEIAQLSKVHCLYTIVYSFSATIDEDAFRTRHHKLHPVLKRLRDLFCTYLLHLMRLVIDMETCTNP